MRLYGRGLFHKFPDFLNQLLLGTVDISVVLIHNLPVAVDDEGVRNHLHSERTLEVAVRVEQDLVLPSVVVYERLHLVDVLSLVDRDSNHLHPCLSLPVLINLADGRQLTVARLAPCGEEVDDKWFAVVGQSVGLHDFSVDVFQCH